MQTQEEMNVLVPEKLAEIERDFDVTVFVGYLSLVVVLGALSLPIVTLMYDLSTNTSKIFISV